MDENTLLDRVIRAYFRGNPDRPLPANDAKVSWDDKGATVVLNNVNSILARYHWHAANDWLRRLAG